MSLKKSSNTDDSTLGDVTGYKLAPCGSFVVGELEVHERYCAKCK